MVIEIFRGNILPYYLKKYGKNEGVYIRIGATNRKASFDQEINYEIKFESLDIAILKDKFEQIGKTINKNTMENLKLVIEEQGVLYPTNGLLIILGLYEHCNIKCSRFKGTTMDVFIDRKEYKGDIFNQLDDAESFIKNHISLKSEINGLQRTDYYEVPIKAIRESLTNAVVHRDYVNTGRDIKIGIYDDMINIVSPGGFPSTITQEDILEGRSEIRNKVVARVLKELKYIEQWGSGIRRIKSSCMEAGLMEPVIEEKGDFVNVNLYRKTMIQNEGINHGLAFNEQEERIINHIRKNDGKITSKETEKILSVKNRRARDILKEMIEKGILERVGSAANTYYRERSKN